MIRIELKHIKKNGFFKFENTTSARYWRKGRRSSDNKSTWVHYKDVAKRGNPNSKVYTKIEYIKPSKALDVFNLEFV